MNHEPDIFNSKGWYLLALAVSAVYLASAWQLADNLPKYDDLNDVFGFFKELTLASSAWQKAGAFFYPNNEHITATSHMVYWIQYQLTSTVSFRGLVMTGHLVIIMTGFLLGACLAGHHKPFYCLAMVLAYVNLYSWDSSFKAMTALSNQSVILFAVASLFTLHRYPSLAASIVLAFLASVSQGNGILVWLVGGVMLAFDPGWQSHRKRSLCIWGVSALLTVFLYYWVKKTYSPAPGSFTPADVWHLWQQSPWLPLTSTLAFLGSTGFPKQLSHLAIATGVLTSAIILVSHWRRPASQTLLFYITVFFIASAITASGLRGLIGGSETVVMESRYKMYSLALLIIAAVMLAEALTTAIQQRIAIIATLLAAIVLHLDAYRQIPLIKAQSAKFHESYTYWIVDGDFKRHTIYFAPMSDHFLFIAHYLNLFDFFQFVPANQVLTATPPATDNNHCPATADNPALCQLRIQHRGNAIAIQLTAQASAPSTHNVVWLCDNNANTIAQIALPDLPAGESTWLIRESQVAAGQYQAWMTGDGIGTCAVSPSTPRDQAGIFNKKPRKVDEQMRQLFNASGIASGIVSGE